MIDQCPSRIDAYQPLVLHSGDSTLSQLAYGQSITDACTDRAHNHLASLTMKATGLPAGPSMVVGNRAENDKGAAEAQPLRQQSRRRGRGAPLPVIRPNHEPMNTQGSEAIRLPISRASRA